jgi:hypothetical protein
MKGCCHRCKRDPGLEWWIYLSKIWCADCWSAMPKGAKGVVVIDNTSIGGKVAVHFGHGEGR